MPNSGATVAQNRRSRDHHVDRADFNLLHHVGFLAKLAVRKYSIAMPLPSRALQIGGEALVTRGNAPRSGRPAATRNPQLTAD